MKRFGYPIALSLALGGGLAALTSRVADWFVMTDELLYERLALSIVQLHSPLPQVHGVVIGSIDQLYPLLLAPAFAVGTIAHDLHVAHVLNAFAMASAALPAYLLARRVTGNAWASSLAALLTIVTPWVTLSSFLLTGVVAYPAFVWAILAFHVTMTEPSPRHDALAALALVVAISARTQFVALVVVLAVVAAKRWRSHRVLVALYAVGAVLALVVLATGHSLLGTYSSTAHSNPLPAAVVPALFSHLAVVAVGLGILPFVVGGAWLVRRDSFATLASVTIVVLTVETASFDERFGAGIVRDRYLFYVVPLLAVAFAAALASWERPGRALVVPLGVLAVGFAVTPLPVFDKLNVDTPASLVNGYLLRELGGIAGARIFLIAVALVAALLVYESFVLLGRRSAVLLAVLALVLATGQTAYAWQRLFRIDGTAGRPLTVDPSADLGWIDRAVGRSANVTLIPFPVVSGDYWSSAAYWWDAEFWNASATRSAGIPGAFEWTPSTFPKLALVFDRTTGQANVSPDGDVLQAIGDTRFHLAGTVLLNNRNAFLVEPERPWRADWSTTGLFDDGWTKPAVVAHIRVYPYPGQSRSVLRSLTVSAFAPSGVTSRPLRVGGATASAGANEVSVGTTVCVAPLHPGDVAVSAEGSSAIYGDTRTVATFVQARMGGVQIARIELSGQIGADC